MDLAGRKQRLYYGWVLVLTLSVTETTSWGVLYYAFAVFLLPMRQELGWSTTQLTGAFSLALLVTAIAGIPVGRWLDRHGPRLLMTAGSIAATLLVLAWARVESLTAYYLIWIGIGVTMAAVLYEPAFAVVAKWFIRRRSRALTVLTFIAGFASVIYIPLAGWLVESLGWRDALVTLAIILAIGTIPPHALLLRREPTDLGLEPDGGPLPASAHDTGSRQVERSVPVEAALRDGSFWWLVLAFFLATFAVSAILVHLIPYLIEQGYEAGFAAAMTGLIGAMGLPGRLIFTPLGGLIPRRFVTSFLFLLQTAALLVLLLVPTTVGVTVFVVLFGAGFGAITPARAALIAEYYGSAHYGSINSVMAFATILARAAAPVGVGMLYSGFGGYDLVWWGLLVLSAVAIMAVLRTGQPAVVQP